MLLPLAESQNFNPEAVTHSAGDAGAPAAYFTPKPSKGGCAYVTRVRQHLLGTPNFVETPWFFLVRLRRLQRRPKLGDSFLFDIGSVKELSSGVAGPCLETRELESACASRFRLLIPVSGLS